MADKKKIALVLGGGGARGVSHIGVLKVLEKAGLIPSKVIGVSMGAVVGGLYALDKNICALETEAIGKRKREMARMIDLGRPKLSILKGRRILEYLESLTGNKDFSDLKIPFECVATDLETGREIILKRGNLAKAIQASISVPGIFPPVKINGKFLIDGGVVDPTPIKIIDNEKFDLIIAVDLIMKRNIKLSNPGLVTTLMQSYEIIRTQAVKFNLRSIKTRHIIIKPKLGGTIDSFKFNDIAKFIKAGETAAQNSLPEIMKMIK